MEKELHIFLSRKQISRFKLAFSELMLIYNVLSDMHDSIIIISQCWWL